MTRVYVALLTVQVLFGLWPVAGAEVLDHVSPPALIGFRTWLGAPLLLVLSLFDGKVKVTLQDLLALAGLAALGITANQLLFVEGLVLAGPTNAVIFAVLIPAQTALFATMLGHEKIQARRIAGIGVAFLGAAILVEAEKLDLSSDKFIGGLYFFGNTGCYALYLVLGRKVFERVGGLRAIAIIFAFGAIEALPWTLQPTLQVAWAGLPTTAWIGLTFILVGPTMGTYALNAFALRKVQSSVVAVFVYLQPLIGTIAAWVVRGEKLTVRGAVAGAVICVGVYVATLKSASPAKAEKQKADVS